MSIFSSIPAICKVANSLRVFNHYEKDIMAARATGDAAHDREVTGSAAKEWAEDACRRLGITVNVHGSENLPEQDGFLVISNHQGYADILSVLIAMDGHQIGFVAKDSLEKIPMLGRWIRNIGGLFLKRGNAREAMKSLQEGGNRLMQGYNLIIFPEGTRSRETRMRHFKGGSFKMAFKAKVPILPVTIEGAYKVYEEKNTFSPATIDITIHPAVPTAGLDRHGQHKAEVQVEKTIRAALPNQEVLPDKPEGE